VLWMDTADMVLSGCSLGLHIALGLKKPIVTWFGVSCSQEIDLFDRGIKLQSDVTCSPCWRKSCTNEPKCFNMVAPGKILEATRDVVRQFVALP
jgi:heptosyltransferase II